MTQNDNTNNAESRGAIFRWMSIFSMGQISEKVFMLAKLVLVAFLFGASRERDVYLLAMMIPAVFFNLVGDAMYIYCLSVFTQHKNTPDGPWQITSILLTLALVLVALFTTAYMLAAPFVFHMFAGNQLNADMLHLSVRLALILSPLFFFYTIHAMLKGFSEAFRLFGVSSFIFSITNFIAFCALWLLRDRGILGLAYATLISEAAAMAMYVPQLVRKGFRYKPDFRFTHPDLRGTYAYAMKITTSTGVFKFSILINRLFALTLPPGAISIFDYAFNLVQNFSTLLRSFVNAVFPSLTQATNEQEHQSVRRFHEMALRAMALVGIPMCALIYMLRLPIVKLFERGAFGPDVAMQVSHTVAFLAPCILMFPLTYLAIRLFAVLQKTRMLTMLGILCMALIAGFDALLLGRGVTGMALANTLALAITFAACSIALSRNIGAINGALVGPAVLKALAAAGACMAGIHMCNLALAHAPLPDTFAGLLVILVVQGAAGTMCALLALFLLRTREIMDAFGFIRKAVGK